ncbi:MAG: 1-deoxy-D-xylulose-5-phosphate reductoisomerase [Candidatus Accumulibacter sp.]|jgi:1-deoxy-D-xylulose-5-phosphate reductoisomerase|nr:1-deoxy-D-xylulose-5-phosphate reductoisomerase [Accumulibacter sp.]
MVESGSLNPPRRIVILGATGSIGASTLDVVARHPERYSVFALTANREVEKLARLCLRHAPRYAVVVEPGAAEKLRRLLEAARCPTEVLDGASALCEVARAPEADVVMSAIVGAAGLPPTLAAALAGKKILLANKEALVMAGALFMRAVRGGGARLLPIDSEHNAIFQSLPADYSGDPGRSGVRGILLTASGGPFRKTPREDLANVTPEQACAHPNWRMGRKISVDSATMMNKGLEVIEAHWLFNIPAENIQVVIHPQSVIHSLVQYVDGSVLAELGHPDMRTPIAQALAYPERIASGVEPLDLFAVAALHFERPDFDRFPCLGLAYQALREGESAPVALNAANEVAVRRFLEGHIGFLAIDLIVARVMEKMPVSRLDSLDDVFAADAAARRMAERIVDEIKQ